MKINLPPSGNVIANLNTQAKQQLIESANSSSSAAQQTHLSFDHSINNLLKKLMISVQSRENLINSLPANIKEAAVKILQQNAAAPEKLLQGLANLANSQKTAADTLLKLITGIQDAQVIKGSFTLEMPQSQTFIKALDDFWSPLLKRDSSLSRLFTNNNFSLLTKYINESTNFQQLFAESLKQTSPDEQYWTIKELVALFAKTVPESIARFAEKNKLPDLVSLWAGIKLRNALPWVELNAQQAQKSCDILLQLAASLQTYAAGSEETGSAVSNQKLFSMTVPVYFENNPNPYPAYIHVYHDAQNEAEQQDHQMPETWLRICLSTENLGVVDTVFRLYQENLISIRVAFSLNGVADIFSEYLPEIETQLSNSVLKLTDIKVK